HKLKCFSSGIPRRSSLLRVLGRPIDQADRFARHLTKRFCRVNEAEHRARHARLTRAIATSRRASISTIGSARSDRGARSSSDSTPFIPHYPTCYPNYGQAASFLRAETEAQHEPPKILRGLSQ